MKPNIYISVPIGVDWNTFVIPHCEKLKSIANLTFWIRGAKYDDSKLRNADAVLFILADNAFQMDYNDMTSGILSEIELAKEMKKPMLLGYRLISDKSFGIYEIECRHYGVTGKPGQLTKGYFEDLTYRVNYPKKDTRDESFGSAISYSKMQETLKETPSVDYERKTPDLRLLLLC